MDSETGDPDADPTAASRGAAVLLAAAAAVQFVLFALFARDSSFSLSSGSPAIFLKFGVLWLPFLAAAAAAWRGGVRIRPAVVAGLVLLFYLAALSASPPAGVVDLGGGRERVFSGWFSDDWHRYLLDGELWLEGENACKVVPDDLPPSYSGPARQAPFVNHPDVATFYSPLAEIWFTLVALSGTGWRGLGIGNALAHSAAVLLLAAVLRGRRHRTALLLLFALNPLLLVEGAPGIHFDPLVMLALLGIHVSLERRRPGAAAACRAAAVGLKLFPLILAPCVLRRVGWRRMLVAGAALVLLLLSKESAFFLAAAWWTVKGGVSPRRAAVSAALGAGYLAALALSGLAYPPGVPLAFPSFTAENLEGGAWGVLIAVVWLVPAVAITLRRGLGRPEALALFAYAALLVGFSMFWETRLWLAAAPLALYPRVSDPMPEEA